MTLFIVSVSMALLISAICSLMEATLLSLTPSQVAELAHRQPKLGAIWQRFKANVQPPIATILLLNTAAHTIGASVAGSQFDDLFGDEWILAFSLVFTFVMLQFTEILPKTIGVRYNREVARIIGRPLNATVVALRPLLRVIHLINRPLEGRRGSGEHPATIEEITALAGLARISNQITLYQERIIRGASRLSQLSVEQIMIPVDQVSVLSTRLTLSEAVVAAHIEAHTRFPVCEGDDRDQIVGYVNFKEMIYYLRTNPGDPSFRGIIRPVRFVAPGTSAADMLQGFANEHVHMAIVRSDEGKTLGMVTFEDVVEELVGDLEDEFDRLPRMLHPLTGGTWMIGGGTPMSEIASIIGPDLSAAGGSLSTWLLDKFGRMPRPGDVYREGSLEFLVRRIRRGKIFEVAVNQRAVA
ncbi:MAG: hemolysin family protein [Pirellulaceae bacterium]